MIFISLILGIFFLLVLLGFSGISAFENEKLAFRRSLLLAIVVPLPYILIGFNVFSYSSVIATILLGITGIFAIALFIPIKGRFKFNLEIPAFRIDERTTIFSRKEIMKDPLLQQQFYINHPEKKLLDEEWQLKPGLMDPNSAFFSPLSFAAADATFYPIEMLRSFIDGTVNEKKLEYTPEKMSEFITHWAKKLGVISIGFCAMQDYHYYSIRGRGKYYNKQVDTKHIYGIALTVEMDKEFLSNGPAGPTLMESAQQYLNSGVVAIQIAKFIRNLGFEARAHIDGNYEVICPLVARDAGLGEIGRMGLLITPELGPRVRIAVISTNIPLKITPRTPDYTVLHFCTICKKCARICPGQAISNTQFSIVNGTQRWPVNHEKCFNYWCISGTDCGRCMSVCPYSHPNNFAHNLVRRAIKNNILFRYVAVKIDDFFYGSKPFPKKVQQWIEPDPINH